MCMDLAEINGHRSQAIHLGSDVVIEGELIDCSWSWRQPRIGDGPPPAGHDGVPLVVQDAVPDMDIGVHLVKLLQQGRHYGKGVCSYRIIRLPTFHHDHQVVGISLVNVCEEVVQRDGVPLMDCCGLEEGRISHWSEQHPQEDEKGTEHAYNFGDFGESSTCCRVGLALDEFGDQDE